MMILESLDDQMMPVLTCIDIENKYGYVILLVFFFSSENISRFTNYTSA